jgi:hemoglobin
MTIVANRRWIILTCYILAGACSVGMAAELSLYERLGGPSGVKTIADTLIDRVVANPLTGPNFKDSKLDRIKKLLAEQICDLSGGPCHYSGDPMKEVHAGHHISESMFYVMVDTLRDILKERHVDLRSRNELLKLLAPMKRDVVEHAGAPERRPTSSAAAAAAPP